MNKFLSWAVAIIIAIFGLKIMYTKKLPQGNSGMGGGEVFIGDTAYIIGGILLFLGLYIIYLLQKNEA